MKYKDRRRWLSDLFILGGLSLLFGTALFWAKAALAAKQMAERPYLVSTVALDLPLPTLPASPTPLPLAEFQSLAPVEGNPAPQIPAATPDLLQAPEIISTPLQAQAQPQRAITLTSENSIPAQPATPAPSAGPVIRLVIPHIRVDQAVVPVGQIGSGENLQWDTNALLANQNRRDLVGQLPTSVNPGDGGNIVLVGHNYNRGTSNWYGVFVNLKALTPGDRITVYTQNGAEFLYEVQEVRQLSWAQKEGEGLGEHQDYLWPTPHEQLTLVTCGGANLLRWSARVYVVALPVED